MDYALFPLGFGILTWRKGIEDKIKAAINQ
jgi:hypothetical protein